MFIWAAALTLITLCAAAVMPGTATAAPPEGLKDKYIVVLKDTAPESRGVADEHARNHQIKVSRVYSHALKGYAAEIPAGRLIALRHDPRVDYIEADGIATTTATQSGATWGLDRVDQRSRTLNGTFRYSAAGTGVKAYIIDTGIRASHTDFGGRVVQGFDAVDSSLPADDCNGHGTHVAGTTGGNRYGVAKNVTLVAVRVLDCGGSGSWSGIIAGIDYVTADHQAGQPAVANMSLGGGASSAIDSAVKKSIADGVSYAVAAGNSSTNACNNSPARVSEAMTISATDRNDARPSWANYGSCVDWFAPGAAITSAWHTGDTATNTISGTSMATPHSAGVAALYLAGNRNASPSQVRQVLYFLTTKNIVYQDWSANDHLLFTNL